MNSDTCGAVPAGRQLLGHCEAVPASSVLFRDIATRVGEVTRLNSPLAHAAEGRAIWKEIAGTGIANCR